jgi:hypothetical protein
MEAFDSFAVRLLACSIAYLDVSHARCACMVAAGGVVDRAMKSTSKTI